MSFKLANRIEIRDKYSNIDQLWGPYESIEEACEAINESRRERGLTVGIISNDNLEEYWWKLGTSDDDLERKVEKINLTLSILGNSVISTEEGVFPVIRFNIEGRSSIQKGLLYRVQGDSEILLNDINNLAKGDNSYSITNLSVSGVYTYRLKVIDSSGTYATDNGGQDHIDYTIRYGGVSTIYNFTQLNTIKIKNIYSVSEKYFTCNISVRDDSFKIISMLLSDGENVNIPLTPTDSLKNNTNTFIGNNYYFLPTSDVLQSLDGKTCYLILNYTEDEVQYSQSSLLFTLLNVNSLELIPESTFTDYYLDLPSYYIFQLQSGVENISVTLSKHQESDFDFETVTVATYKRFSLKVIPKNIKSNAQIKLNYSFYYNNQENTGTFTFVIGNILSVPEKNYYDPPVGTTNRDDIVYSDSNYYDIIEDGQYYKIINSQLNKKYYSSSFLLDIYCRINKINDKSIKYLTINYGNEEIGYITEDEINCRGITTDTPLDEWVQIGLGYNLQESVERNNTSINVSYFAIYINGMIIKNILIDNENVKELAYDSQKQLSITLNNGIHVQKCFIYYKNNGSNSILPNTSSGTSIMYNNYLSHNVSFSEPTNLPELKLIKITDSSENEKYFNLINDYKESHDEDLITHTTTFGTIGLQKATSMEYYDSHYGSDTIESDATLFRQSVEIKKPAQKEYAVLCRGQYLVNGINLLEGVIIEVHTQGTSTLVYSVPNFRFIFWKENNNIIEHYYPEFIINKEINNTPTYYHEYIYTAKADYMDSSHLNNTPTCNYYNNLIQLLISENEIEGSPSARQSGIDAIMGMPIIMEISDSANDFNDYFTNIGSFMLNVDKTGESLGFEIDSDGEHFTCLSFEGTSNDNEHGSAGRFILSDSRLTYFENDEEIETAYNNVQQAISNKLINEPGTQNPIGDLNGYPYAQWCQFFSDGLEYRYPDSDIIKSKNKKLSKIMKLSDFKKLYRMWSWVSKSDEYDVEKYKNEFTNYFDLHYCMLYFIQLMIFGQTDNLGKNAMFDCWNGEIWYPRPYDLDSQAGLDNNGNDNIAPFVEIKPEFSLNYDSSYTQEQLEENYLTEDSTILYGTQYLDRYHYSSNTSKLWINFYKNFKNEIEAFYVALRTKYNYSADSIISSCKNQLIDVLGINQYNQDFINKYLANSDQGLAYGNRWHKFQKWMKQRFAFCDSYFKASESAIYAATSAFTYNIKIDSPQYITQQYQNNIVTKFVTDFATFSAGSSAATKTTLKVNQNSVLETSLFKYVSKDSGESNYVGLVSLDVSGNKKIQSIISLVGNQLPNLRDLNISNSSVNVVSIPFQLKKLTAENVTLTQLTFSENCLVEEISLKNSTLNGNLDFTNLPNLKKLDLTNCKINSNITFADLPNLDTLLLTDASFNGEIIIQDGVKVTDFDFSGIYLNNISFSGSNLQIDTLDFHRTIFGQSTINLNAISKNIKNIYFNNCTGLQHLEVTENYSFEKIEVFSIYNSSISSLGVNSNQFNAGLFNNISSLKRVELNSDGDIINNRGIITKYNFTFKNTKIVNIINLNWNGTGKELFSDCLQLKSINGTLTLTDSIEQIFYRCSELSTIPSININDSVVTAKNAFVMNNSLGYSNISSIIKKCTHVLDFTQACQCTKFSNNQSINLTDLFSNNQVVKDLTYMFVPKNLSISGLASVSNSYVITGTIPASVTTTNGMFWASDSVSVPYEIIKNCNNLINCDRMFTSTTVTFTGNNIPVITDKYGTTVSLTNTIKKEFFPTNIESMSGMFYGTNVQIIDDEVFKNLNNLKDCSSAFGGNQRKFGFTNSNNEQEDLDLDITNLWLYNPKLTKIGGCFSGIYNVFCSGLNFNSLTTNVDASGLFGISSTNKDSSIAISLRLGDISTNLKLSNNYSIPGNGNYRGFGTFQSRKIYILDEPDDQHEILKEIKGDCTNLFKDSDVYIVDNKGEVIFNLSNVTTAREMFSGCNLYKQSNIINRFFVNVEMPISCSNYSYMFYKSNMLNRLPSLRASNILDLSYAFSNAYININVEIPANYFQICKNSIQNTSYMFSYNKYIVTLEYNENVGLFQDCIELNNVTGMFYSANYLHKGIPINIFGQTPLPKLTSLAELFGYTCIMYKVENNSFKWIDQSTIMPLENLVSIEGLFRRNSPVNISESGYSDIFNSKVMSGNEEIYVINPSTFTTKKISNIKNAFDTFRLDIPFQFTGFDYGTEAFYQSSITEIDSNFVDEQNISSIKDVSRMFYDYKSNNVGTKSIKNLGNFVQKILNYPNIQKANIAGNLINDDIPDNLKNSYSSATDHFSAFSLPQKEFYQDS